MEIVGRDVRDTVKGEYGGELNSGWVGVVEDGESIDFI
jgi:hypothetical protein